MPADAYFSIGETLTSIGAPGLMGALIILLIKRSIQKAEETNAQSFKNVIDQMTKIGSAVADQGKAIQEIQARQAIHDYHSELMQRAVDEGHDHERQLILINSKTDAALRLIDDLKDRTRSLEQEMNSNRVNGR